MGSQVNPVLAKLSDDDLAKLIKKHGSRRKVAVVLGVPYSTLGLRLNRGQAETPAPVPRRTPLQPVNGNRPRITRESLEAAMKPENLCRVAAFLESLDEQDREIVEEALAYNGRNLSARRLREEWLIVKCGFKPTQVPSIDDITHHRRRESPCRCPR